MAGETTQQDAQPDPVAMRAGLLADLRASAAKYGEATSPEVLGHIARIEGDIARETAAAEAAKAKDDATKAALAEAKKAEDARVNAATALDANGQRDPRYVSTKDFAGWTPEMHRHYQAAMRGEDQSGSIWGGTKNPFRALTQAERTEMERSMKPTAKPVDWSIPLAVREAELEKARKADRGNFGGNWRNEPAAVAKEAVQLSDSDAIHYARMKEDPSHAYTLDAATLNRIIAWGNSNRGKR